MLPFLFGHQAKVQVDLIWSTDCPVAQRWVQKVAAWHHDHPSAQVIWWFPNDSLPATQAYAKRFHLTGDLRATQGADLAFQFALDRFPSAVVRRGDQAVFVGGVGLATNPDSRFLLAEGYAAAIAGKSMIPSRSEPQGCTLPDPLIAKPNSPVSYLKHIKPLIGQYCLPCHSPGGAAPFRLDRYPDVRRWSHMILDVLRREKMPPVRLYDKIRNSVPAPSSVAIEQFQVWRDFGAPDGTGPDNNPEVQQIPKNRTEISVTSPKMGRFRFIDVSLQKVERTSGYTIIGAPQGSVRMVWTFLAQPSPRPLIEDKGERWKSIPKEWEFVHAGLPNSSLTSVPYFFSAEGRKPVVRLLLYGSGEQRAVKLSLTPLTPPKTNPARSLRFPFESGQFAAFNGVVDLSTAIDFANPKRALSFTAIGDPTPSSVTLFGPNSSWLIGKLMTGSFMPTAIFSSSATASQVALNVTYGDDNMTGLPGPRNITFGDNWNEARLEAYLVIPAAN